LTHKLLLDLELQVEGDYKKYLGPREGVRGVQTTLVLYLTDLSKAGFPGGKFTLLRIEQIGLGLQGVGADLLPTVCPSIPPSGKIGIVFPRIFTGQEGLGTVSAAIESKDNDGIEYYQRPEGPPFPGTWVNFYYIVNRETITTIRLLEELIATTKRVS
jgi:hypothetical protein